MAYTLSGYLGADEEFIEAAPDSRPLGANGTDEMQVLTATRVAWMDGGDVAVFEVVSDDVGVVGKYDGFTYEGGLRSAAIEAITEAWGDLA